MTCQLVEFPPQYAALSLPNALRQLADEIEAGEYGEAHNLTWVIDCGNSNIEIGILGKCGDPGITAHFLLALGQRKIEMSVL